MHENHVDIHSTGSQAHHHYSDYGQCHLVSHKYNNTDTG